MSTLTNNAVGTQNGTHADRLTLSATAGLVYRESDTGLIYRGNGTGWDLSSARGRVVKTADQTVTNSDTLTNDTHLKFPIEVSEIWFVEGYLALTGASTTADWQFGWTAPDNATALWAPQAPGTTTTYGGWGNTAAASTPVVAIAIDEVLTNGSGAVSNLLAFAGFFYGDDTAGTIQLQWAQGTATDEDNKVLAGSFLRLERLA